MEEGRVILKECYQTMEKYVDETPGYFYASLMWAEISFLL